MVQKRVNLANDQSRQELSNEYLFAKFGFDTAENISDSASNVSVFIYLFVPHRYLQFLRIVRFTSQPASRERVLRSLLALRVQIPQALFRTSNRISHAAAHQHSAPFIIEFSEVVFSCVESESTSPQPPKYYSLLFLGPNFSSFLAY